MIQSDFIEKLENYLDEHYNLEIYKIFGESSDGLKIFDEIEFFLKKFFGSYKNRFGFYINKLMKNKDLTESQILEKTTLPEDCFSLLRSAQSLKIQREAVFNFCLALKSDFQDTNILLDLSWNKYLNTNNKRDVIIAFFIENKIDDIFLLNETLEYYNLRNLSGEKIFSDEAEKLFEPIKNYIDENYHYPVKYSIKGDFHKNKVREILEDNKKTFSDYLRELIHEKNLSEVEVYKKAHLDRRIFSKLRNEKDYKPSKRTILAISFGMGLKLEETEKLLKNGGYALSDGDKFDLIIKYFFENEIYDLFLINEVLDYYNFKPICY